MRAILSRVPDLAWRVLGVAFFLGVIAWRVLSWWDGSLIWWVETAVYALIVLGYIRRAPAFEPATSWGDIVLPLVGAPAPFLLLLAEPQPLVRDEVSLGFLIVGGTLSVVSYAFLGGSFSILVEARPLAARGPYRVVRHPVYLGQLLAATGVVLRRFVWWNVALGVGFAAIQIARAVLEERKLVRATPGYAEYRARTWMLIPLVL